MAGTRYDLILGRRVVNVLSRLPQVCRAVQYFARFFAWLLLSRGYKIQAARWDALKAHLALGRKRESESLEHSAYDDTDYC